MYEETLEQQYYVISLYECVAPIITIPDYTYHFVFLIILFTIFLWSVFMLSIGSSIDPIKYGKIKSEVY